MFYYGFAQWPMTQEEAKLRTIKAKCILMWNQTMVLQIPRFYPSTKKYPKISMLRKPNERCHLRFLLPVWRRLFLIKTSGKLCWCPQRRIFVIDNWIGFKSFQKTICKESNSCTVSFIKLWSQRKITSSILLLWTHEVGRYRTKDMEKRDKSCFLAIRSGRILWRKYYW